MAIIEVFQIAGGKVVVWSRSGRCVVDDSLAKLARIKAAGSDFTGAHDLLLFESGSFADVTRPELGRLIDAMIDTFPERYRGGVRLAVVADPLNDGIARLFCALLEQDQRIRLPAMTFRDARAALEWFGLRDDELRPALTELGPGPWQPNEHSAVG